MDLVNRLIAWAAYVTGAVLIGSGAFFSFHYYRQNAVSADAADVASNSGRQAGMESASGAVPAVRGTQLEQLYQQRAQIRRLQSLLDQKTKLLQQRTALLDQKSAEQMALRAELDDAIDLLGVLAAEIAGRNPSSSGSRTTDTQLQTELERLREESEKSRVLAEQQQGDLDRLKTELGATDQGISQLQRQAETEFQTLAADREAFESAVSDTLVRLGEAAVPALITQLGHPRADARQWAAKVLGDLGPLAKDAVPALLDALEDKDAAVRSAASGALDKIDVPHR